MERMSAQLTIQGVQSILYKSIKQLALLKQSFLCVLCTGSVFSVVKTSNRKVRGDSAEFGEMVVPAKNLC